MKKLKLLSILILLINTNFLFAEDIDDILSDRKSATSSFFTKEYRNYLEKNHNKLLEERPLMQTSVVSPQKHFRVHFDTTGKHAVAHTDLNHNGIYDYIDTVCSVFDYVYQIEIEKIGFRAPRTDLYEQDCKLYDIYVKDQIEDEEAYGYTTPLKSYKTNGNFPKWYSNITIDNNYSPLDTIIRNSQKHPLFATTGSDALKVTAAHEFFHAIQFAYADDIKNGLNTFSVYEMNSVCMEIIVYPEIEDFLIYVNNLFKDISKYIFSNSAAVNGYRYGIFFYMLSQKYGTDFLLEFWQTVEKGDMCFEALDNLLLSKESSLANEWQDFLKWIYFTNNRAIPNKYFPFAKKCNALSPTSNSKFYQTFLESNYLAPYEIKFARVVFPTNNILITADTADYLMTNLDTKNTIEQRLVQQPYSLYISEENKENFVGIFENRYWYHLYSPSEFPTYLHFLYTGSNVRQIDNAYPQPFDKNKHKNLYFPVPDYVELGKKIELVILNTNMKEILSIHLPVIIHKHNRVITYPSIDLENGVYIYQINVSGINEKIGKLFIKN